MATPVNDRDVLIMATVPRFTAASDQGMFLTPSSTFFKVAANTTGSPSSIDFKATLLNIAGTVAWSSSAGVVITTNGNTATLTYANFSAASGTITASITVDGTTYTQVANVAKISDGATGSNGTGTTTYTWVKYADSAVGANLSDDPTGKAYIGLAYNKTTLTESTLASDYSWSLIKGDPGTNGSNGITYYTWIKYSDFADGTSLYDTPTTSTLYIGIAVNRTSATKSTLKTDYTWSKFKGDQGVPGNNGTNGVNGVRGNINISAATGGSIWSDTDANAAITASGYGARQFLDAVTLYNQAAKFAKTKVWTGSAWVDLVQILDGNLLVTGSVYADALAVNSVKASNIVVSSDGDNILPDEAFRDLRWWGRLNALVDGPFPLGNFWKNGYCMDFNPTTDGVEQNTTSSLIPLLPGATYRLEMQVYIDPNFSGGLSVWLHIPNVAWQHFGTGITGSTFSDSDPIQFFSGSPKGTLTYATTVTIPTSVTMQDSSIFYPNYTQIRIHSKVDAGYIQIGSLKMTRVSDSVLIKDGAVTAQKLYVQTLSAVTGQIGFFRSAPVGNNRIEISDGLIEGWNSSNIRRFRISAN